MQNYKFRKNRQKNLKRMERKVTGQQKPKANSLFPGRYIDTLDNPSKNGYDYNQGMDTCFPRG